MIRSVFAGCLLSLIAIVPASAANFWDHAYREPAVTQPGRVEWAWDGGSKLAVGVPAVVHYSEQGAPRVVVTGPDEMLRHVRFGDGNIVMDNDGDFFSWDHERLEITVTGAAVNNFVVAGSSRMLLGKLQRDSLSVNVSGSGSAELDASVKNDARLNVSGSGHITFGSLQARHLEARISGSGDIGGAGHADDLNLEMSGSGHFGDITSSRADVSISGSGRATIAPHDEAHVHISGSGTVHMPVKPPRLDVSVSGSGRVVTAMAD